MNIDAQAMQDAEQWLVRLDSGSCSSADFDAFERWKIHPEHALAYEKAERLWRAFGQTSGHPDLERLSAQAFADTAPGAQRFFNRRLTLGLAASLAVCALAASAFVVGQRYTPTRSYVTEARQRSTVQLDDGSQVTLNFGTRLVVKLRRDRRELTLKSGEAVFTVAEDAMRPFTVSAGDSEITALGTRFQVRNDTKQVTVTLLEGRIAVDSAAMRQRVQLVPGEQVKVSEDMPRMTRLSVDPEAVSSWTAGRLKFNATPLIDALDEVNRYSTTKIRLQDMAFGKTPVNGVFDIGDTASVVSALEAMLPVEAALHRHGEIVLLRK